MISDACASLDGPGYSVKQTLTIVHLILPRTDHVMILEQLVAKMITPHTYARVSMASPVPTVHRILMNVIPIPVRMVAIVPTFCLVPLNVNVHRDIPVIHAQQTQPHATHSLV
jgi:hypothetical protein